MKEGDKVAVRKNNGDLFEAVIMSEKKFFGMKMYMVKYTEDGTSKTRWVSNLMVFDKKFLDK